MSRRFPFLLLYQSFMYLFVNLFIILITVSVYVFSTLFILFWLKIIFTLCSVPRCVRRMLLNKSKIVYQLLNNIINKYFLVISLLFCLVRLNKCATHNL